MKRFLTDPLPHPASAAGQNLVRRENALIDKPTLDEPLLAVQIGGIVGAYVIFVAITLTLLLFVGRRLRRAVQSSNYTLQVEMMKPKAAVASMDPSPITPTNKSHGFRSWASLTKGAQSRISNNGSVATLDHESVVAADRRKAQEEMEMLYAAVMEHDEQRSAAGTSPTDDNVRELAPRSPISIRSTHTNPFSDYASRIPESHLPPPAPAQQPQPQHAKSTAPLSPRSPTSRLSRISNLSLFHSNSSSHLTSNPSRAQGPNTSNKLRSPRLPLRKLPISSPIASPDATVPISYGEDQIPLSPRLYNPPPPPPVPPLPGTNTTASTRSNLSNTSIRTAAPAPLNLKSAANSSSSLPFREAYPQLLSAPPTKTTILERPEKPLGGPRTGLPTPYSPYMPFTPLTPLTPSRIVTKKQRKREGKENGLRALNEEDAVRDDNDMWGY